MSIQETTVEQLPHTTSYRFDGVEDMVDLVRYLREHIPGERYKFTATVQDNQPTILITDKIRYYTYSASPTNFISFNTKNKNITVTTETLKDVN